MRVLKVAIIGAGFAGITCAYELERYGIKPVIYEKNGFIGEAYEHVTVILNIVHRPMKDSIHYTKKNLGMKIEPLNSVNKLVHYSPNKEVVVEGNFGYLFKRGREKTSIKNQMFSKLNKTKLILNEVADYKKLSEKYDYVVIATGNPNFSEELGCWQDWFVSYEKVGVVEGSFDPNAIIMWINNEYTKNGYIYLAPISDKKAYIVMVLPSVNEKQIEFYWQLFLDMENIKYTIIEEDTLKHKAGLSYPYQVGNIYFTGASVGILDPFLGFGQLNSMKTGSMAARSIVKGKNYEKLIRDVIKNNIYSYEYRKAFNRLSNKDYDRLFTLLKLPGVRHIMYHTQIDVLKWGGNLLSIVNKKYESR